MNILSKFSSSLNETFGCTVVIPKTHDYGYLSKIFGDDKDKILEDFKNTSIVNGGRLISNTTAISFPTNYLLNGKRIFLIDFTNDYYNHGVAEIKANQSLPVVRFSKLEYESYALFHEIGHCLDDKCRYYDLGHENIDSLRWQRECFADFYATLIINLKLNSKEFADKRIIPMRALSNKIEYQTVPSVIFAKNLSRLYEGKNLSEIDILKIAISEWNKLDLNTLLRWKSDAEQNMICLAMIKGCQKCGGLSGFLENFDEEYHIPIQDNLNTFIGKYGKMISENGHDFGKANESITIFQLCTYQNISNHFSNPPKERFDDYAVRYFKKFPDCPLTKKIESCQAIENTI